MSEDGFKTYHRHSTVQARQVGDTPERVVTTNGVETANPGDFILLHDPDGSPSHTIMDPETFNAIYGDPDKPAEVPPVTVPQEAPQVESAVVEVPKDTPAAVEGAVTPEQQTPAVVETGTPVSTPQETPTVDAGAPLDAPSAPQVPTPTDVPAETVEGAPDASNDGDADNSATPPAPSA